MRTCLLALALLGLAGFASAEPLKSGPQPGDDVLSFEPYNVTGPFTGSERCLVCHFRDDPVVMVFAREPTDAVKKLVTAVDAEVGKVKELGSFVVFLRKQDDSFDLELKLWARREKVKHVLFATTETPGSKGYGLHKDADVTVVLYVNRTVVANHAFRPGELKDAEIARVLKDVPKLLPQKKSD
jgi:hypothetical protein